MSIEISCPQCNFVNNIDSIDLQEAWERAHDNDSGSIIIICMGVSCDYEVEIDEGNNIIQSALEKEVFARQLETLSKDDIGRTAGVNPKVL